MLGSYLEFQVRCNREGRYGWLAIDLFAILAMGPESCTRSQPAATSC